MNRSIARIAVFAVLLAGVVSVAMYVQRPSATAANDTNDTWLTLPKDSMDARHVTVRHALAAAFESIPSGDYMDTLAYRCGRDDTSEPREHYRALIGDWMLADDRRTWEVDIYPEGGSARVLVRRSSLDFPPPPPPPPGSAVEPGLPVVRVPRVVLMPIGRLADIRKAWSQPDLWEAQTELTGCSDGRPAFFEACVHGRYYVSRRGCSHAHESVSHLWELFQQRLPPPSLDSTAAH